MKKQNYITSLPIQKTHKERILSFLLGEDGNGKKSNFTCWDVLECKLLGFTDKNQIVKRLSDLENDGLIKPVGATYKREGAKQFLYTVYDLTTPEEREGLALIRRMHSKVYSQYDIDETKQEAFNDGVEYGKRLMKTVYNIK